MDPAAVREIRNVSVLQLVDVALVTLSALGREKIVVLQVKALEVEQLRQPALVDEQVNLISSPLKLSSVSETLSFVHKTCLEATLSGALGGTWVYAQVLLAVWGHVVFELEIQTCVVPKTSCSRMESWIRMMVSLTHRLFVEAQQAYLRWSVPPYERRW